MCSTGMPGVGVLGGRSMILTGGSPRYGTGSGRGSGEGSGSGSGSGHGWGSVECARIGWASKEAWLTLERPISPRIPSANIGRARAGPHRVNSRLATRPHPLSDCYKAACDVRHACRVACPVGRKVTNAAVASRMVMVGKSLADRVIHTPAWIEVEGCEVSESRQYL